MIKSSLTESQLFEKINSTIFFETFRLEFQQIGARSKKKNKNILLFLVYFYCYHITLYLAKKGCLVPVLIISSSLSSMHRTGLPILKDTGFVSSPFCSDAWYKERTAREKTDQASTITRE